MKHYNVSPQGEPVFDWWLDLTGQEIRCPSMMHGRQAHTIGTTYTREDVAMTVEYVKRQIAENQAHGRGGLNARSMTWANFFGPDEECSKFTDNWNLARQSRKKPVPAPTKAVAVVEETKWLEGAAAMAELKARLRDV